MLVLLALAAVIFMAASLVLILLGAATLAATHIAFAAGIMPLIFGAMMHFVPVLTRGRAAVNPLRWLPLGLSVAGMLAVSAFLIPGFFEIGIHLGACLAFIGALVMAAWIVRRGRATLGAPHPCLYWYLAAVLCLALALAAALGGLLWPAQRAALRIFHLHLNTLGFVGLTAIGTLTVLLPTAAARPDATAAPRLRSDLALTVFGVMLLAAGAAWCAPVAYAGLLLLLLAVVSLGTNWAAQFWREISRRDGAAPSLALALFGFAALLFIGAGHVHGPLAGSDAIFGFVLAFLLPLVTGAVSQLLPLWLRPGLQQAWQQQARVTLTRYGALRALAFVAAGLMVALGVRPGAWLAAVALLVFVVQLVSVLGSSRAETA